MKIELKEITVRELAQNYVDTQEAGVTGYDNLLNIRPAYQREFVYKDKQRDAVIDTVKRGFPLNTMYWVDNEDGTFEVLDGQQRGLSICQYVNKKFSIKNENGNAQYFNNLTEDAQKEILDYKLMVYFCTGAHQELRNSVYTGPWLADAKAHFSQRNCVVYNLAGDYMKGSPIKQDLLETTLTWISDGKIDDYMAKHQRDSNAAPLWGYIQNVISWTKTYFPYYRKEMSGVAWGKIYNLYRDDTPDKDKLETKIKLLMKDEDVTKKAGIYWYVLDKDERHLSIRAFNDKQKREAYERQSGICVKCEEEFKLKEMEADHITPWSLGGKTIADNCQMLCKKCNRTKSNK